MFEWQQKLVKRISSRNLQLLLTGKFLFILTIGSLFSIELVRWGYWILFASMFFVVSYFHKAYLAWHDSKKVPYESMLWGFTGAAFLLLFFGIQSPQIPFKLYIIGFSIVMMLPGCADLVSKR